MDEESHITTRGLHFLRLLREEFGWFNQNLTVPLKQIIRDFKCRERRRISREFKIYPKSTVFHQYYTRTHLHISPISRHEKISLTTWRPQATTSSLKICKCYWTFWIHEALNNTSSTEQCSSGTGGLEMRDHLKPCSRSILWKISISTTADSLCVAAPRLTTQLILTSRLSRLRCLYCGRVCSCRSSLILSPQLLLVVLFCPSICVTSIILPLLLISQFFWSKSPSGFSLIRFLDVIIGRIDPGVADKPAPNMNTIRNAIWILMSYGTFTYSKSSGYKLTAQDGHRLETFLDDAVKAGRLTKGLWQKDEEISVNAEGWWKCVLKNQELVMFMAIAMRVSTVIALPAFLVFELYFLSSTTFGRALSGSLLDYLALKSSCLMNWK